ncbi:hypothetical protein CYMTET_21391 [Cymbomonas tetramitiformis]|uniref:peptide-methionine (R)-S-oxide reductase n=1 Tax=Cymbomonas tetramitiformis TaxID=36881 RepID=A0AAE0L397_9CHLO|nr:hypothetical protein CYMTET_21391 [Cymbomonas tetramitiformis]
MASIILNLGVQSSTTARSAQRPLESCTLGHSRAKQLRSDRNQQVKLNALRSKSQLPRSYLRKRFQIVAMKFDATTTEDEWRQKLTPLQYSVMRERETEPKASGAFNKTWFLGTYHCAGCDEPLYKSRTKFESSSGWASFYQSIEGSTRTELTENKNLITADVLEAFYQVHNPEKVGEVESVLADFPNQDELLAALFQTYGAAPGMISQEQLLGFYQHFNHARANPKAVGEILQAFPMQRELVDALYQQYGAAPGGPHFAPLEVTREQLTAFYQEHNPAKVADVDEVLESFPDRMELLQSLKQAYNALPIEIPVLFHPPPEIQLFCNNCGCYHGQIFHGEDFPTPTGVRHAVNSAAVHFEPDPAGGVDNTNPFVGKRKALNKSSF